MKYFKSWLYQRTLPSTGEVIWVLSTRMNRGVTFGGSLVGNSSYSEFTPGQTVVKGQKTRTIWFNDMTDEMSEQYQKSAGGNMFYLGVPSDPTVDVQILTPSEYQSLNDDTDDVFDSEQPSV